jgi:hypothetical protein
VPGPDLPLQRRVFDRRQRARKVHKDQRALAKEPLRRWIVERGFRGAADAALIAPLARELDAHVYAADGTRYA